MAEIIQTSSNIFKLSSGEPVNSEDLEKQIEGTCHYVKYAVIKTDEEEHTVALIFPNKKLFSQPDYEKSLEEGCFCPRSLDELGRCMTGCLKMVNSDLEKRSVKINSASIVDAELSTTDKTLDTSMNVNKENVIEKYRAELLNMYGKNIPVNEEVYLIQLNATSEKVKNKNLRP